MIKIIKESNQSLCDKVRQMKEEDGLFEGPMIYVPYMAPSVGVGDIFPGIDDAYKEFIYDYDPDILKDHGIETTFAGGYPSTEWTELADEAFCMWYDDSLEFNNKFMDGIDNLSDEKVAEYLLKEDYDGVCDPGSIYSRLGMCEPGSTYSCLKAAVKYPDIFGYNSSQISYLSDLDTMCDRLYHYNPDEDTELQKIKELVNSED